MQCEVKDRDGHDIRLGGDADSTCAGRGNSSELAGVFPNQVPGHAVSAGTVRPNLRDAQFPNLEARYRALVEQIPAVVFMAYLDRGIGEAYVSPQIEATLGFSQEEWLEDPVRWYSHIHPDDKQRWSTEAAEMFLTGSRLRSAYRVVARDGRVIWFHCEAKMIRKRGRRALVHSRRRIRHHRSEAD